MCYKRIGHALIFSVIVTLLVLTTGCNITRHLDEGQYLLRENKVVLKSDDDIKHKAEMRENLNANIIQKPNNRWLGVFPFKLWLYNARIGKNGRDTVVGKSVEPPVIYDSMTIKKSLLNMKGYLFHQGYFYNEVRDTTRFRDKKAFVTYEVHTGTNYLINDILYDIDNEEVAELVKLNEEDTRLKQSLEFNYNLIDEERARITTLLRNNGYYYISNDNISFVLDTLNKRYLEDIENPFQSAANFIAQEEDREKPTLDIKIIIRKGEEPKSYTRFGIGDVRVFPDFQGVSDIRDSSMRESTISGTIFKYHDYYVHESVLYRHILLKKGNYYKQSNYDKTISRLNELGIFQSVRVFIREDTADKTSGPVLDVAILLTPAERFDFSPSTELTTGSNYVLGTGLSLSFHNRNVGKGANLLTISTTGAIEYGLDSGKLGVYIRRLGANVTLDFPKFLVPGGQRLTAHYSSAPRTLLSVGVNLQDRVNYFTLINTSSSLTYRWHETETKAWEVTPVFVNLIRVPNTSPEFEDQLSTSPRLRNTYKPTFIEGQTISFIYSNSVKSDGRDYSYIKASLEEAGALVSGVKNVFSDTGRRYDKYVKIDVDAQHFFRRMHSMLALRLYSGVGIPYGHSSSLPYVKQYFAGGPYSIRGWQLRQLGPGGAPPSQSGFPDRTGDIKLEFNAEYRFDIARVFGGSSQLNGALFTDAGNIWLAKPSPLRPDGTEEYPDGQFGFNRIWPDLAISSGIGLRLDIASLLVLRVDVAVRMKDPLFNKYGDWLVGTSKWPWNPNQINTNIAIGYPF